MVGGLVSWCGSCVVVRSRPGPECRRSRSAGRAGRRAGWAAARRGRCRSAPGPRPAGRPVIQAAGTPHMPRMTCVNRAATVWSRITTEALRGIAEHSCSTAATCPAPVRRKARPDVCTVRPEERPVCPGRPRTRSRRSGRPGRPRRTPRPPRRSAGAPRLRACPVSQAAAHSAQPVNPGSTRTTSRRLAHGWSGTMSGCHRIATEPSRRFQAAAPSCARLRPGPAGQQGAKGLAREQGQTERAEQHRRQADVPDHPVQAVLGVGPARVDRQALGPLQPRDVVVDVQARRATHLWTYGRTARPTSAATTTRAASPGSHRTGRRAASTTARARAFAPAAAARWRR